jgi:hypothetical protein
MEMSSTGYFQQKCVSLLRLEMREKKKQNGNTRSAGTDAA